MSANLQIDTREFDKALKEYVATTSRTLAQAINSKAGDLASRAYQGTAKADRQKIAAELGATLGRVKGKSGKLLKGNRVTVGSDKSKLARARSLFVAQLRRLGQLENTTGLTAKLPGWIKKRVGSGGFLAAGWIPAMRTFIKASGGAPRVKGRGFGRATKARDVLNPVAILENNSTPLENRPKAEAIIVKALSNAFVLVTADMEQYLANKAQQAANTVKP